MMSATDLANDEVTRGKIEISNPRKTKNKLKTAAQFCILLVANIFVLTLVYNVWASEKGCPLWDRLMSNKGTVTGIIYNEENPTAIVCGQVVHEGDIVHGYKVLRILREKVELKKNGKILVKEVH